MKRTLFTLAMGALILSSCGGSKPSDATAADPAATTTTAPAPAADPTKLEFNDADWVDKDLSTVAKDLHVSVKLPKDVEIEPADESSVFVKLNDSYKLFIGNETRVKGGIPESIKMDKEMNIGGSEYVSSSLVKENPDGFVFTYQEKDEEGKKHQPESHFYFYLPAKGTSPVVRFADKKGYNAKAPDSAFTVDVANKVYAMLKKSAKQL